MTNNSPKKVLIKIAIIKINYIHQTPLLLAPPTSHSRLRPWRPATGPVVVGSGAPASKVGDTGWPSSTPSTQASTIARARVGWSCGTMCPAPYTTICESMRGESWKKT